MEEASICHWLHALCHVQHCTGVLLQHFSPGSGYSESPDVLGRTSKHYVVSHLMYWVEPTNIM